jgi:hypothetical protein
MAEHAANASGFPLPGKLLIALSGWLVGYDGNYLFDSIGDDYLTAGTTGPVCGPDTHPGVALHWLVKMLACLSAVLGREWPCK